MFQHGLIWTLGVGRGEGVEEFLKVMQPFNYVSGLHKCLEFSQPSWCLGEAV